jgi:hypothetical protein
MSNKISKLFIDGLINIKKRINHKDSRYCFGCRLYTLNSGDTYFKVWDSRISTKTHEKFHASYCVDCFEKSIYNLLYKGANDE